MKTFTFSCVGIALILGVVGQAKAAFIPVDSETLIPFTWGIAYDGDATWSVGQFISTGWALYDTDFILTGSGGASNTGAKRGLAYDGLTDTVFAARRDATDAIYEVSLANTVVQQFNTGTSFNLNGVATDSTDGSLWLAYFDGVIENRTSTGGLISSFVGGGVGAGDWTGIVVDSFNNTLLVLGGVDELFEYDKSGSLIGQQALSLAGNNGLGVEYIADTGKLYVTSQDGVLTILQDAGRIGAVPEPSTLTLFALGGAGLVVFVRRRQQRRDHTAT